MYDETRPVRLPNGKTKEVRFVRFSGLREAAEYGLNVGTKSRHETSSDAMVNWAGGTMATAMQYVYGEKQPPEAKLVQQTLDKVETAFRDRTAVSWEASVAGAYPVVPDFLQGMPECMRQRMSVESDAAPIRIVANTFISASVDKEKLALRGAAIAALAARLAETRPVEFLAILDSTCYRKADQIISYPLDVRNMSVAEISAALASPVVTRMPMYGIPSGLSGYDNSIPPWLSHESEANVRAYLDLQEGDIFVPGFTSYTGEFDDPVAWVNAHLSKQRDLY